MRNLTQSLKRRICRLNKSFHLNLKKAISRPALILMDWLMTTITPLMQMGSILVIIGNLKNQEEMGTISSIMIMNGEKLWEQS